MDGLAPASTPRDSGLDSTNDTGNVNAGAIPVSLAEGVVNEDASLPARASATGDILADLGKLQMEVDALRGKYEMEKEKGA